MAAATMLSHMQGTVESCIAVTCCGALAKLHDADNGNSSTYLASLTEVGRRMSLTRLVSASTIGQNEHLVICSRYEFACRAG